MDSKEAFEIEFNKRFDHLSSPSQIEQARAAIYPFWREACAYQRAQDLAAVEAVKATEDLVWWEAACEAIVARITAEEPGEG